MLNKFSYLVFSISIFFFGAVSRTEAYSLSVEDSGNQAFPSVYANSEDDLKFPLLDSDPLSSGWTFLINENFVSPADSGWLRSYESNGSVSVIIYSDRAYLFEQRATISDSGSHILISAEFTNNSSETITVIPVLLLDTFLGEVTGLPFHLPDGSYVSGETVISSSRIPEWIKSEKNVESPSLVLIFDEQLATTPDSIALANWLRLKQQGVFFSPEDGRDFDYLPFSEGDSAVLLSYREKKIASGAKLDINIIIGLDTMAPDSAAFEIAKHVDPEPGIENKRLREYTLRRRIEEIRTLLDSLDYLLDNSESITSDAVLDLERITATQEKLRAEYENL